MKCSQRARKCDPVGSERKEGHTGPFREEKEQGDLLAVVGSIPADLHSSDLRGFFCDWVEASR